MEDDLCRQHAWASTPQTAVTELQYVVPKLGASLQGVEIGNELNLYNDSNIESVWHSYAQAIHTTFPGTAVAGPGVFEDINYATKFINGEGKVIDIVTHHYYRGQAGTSMATLANLMNLDSAVTSQSQALANATKSNKIAGGYRWGEMNSYSSHGAKGISNALASALWGINFMLTTAGYGIRRRQLPRRRPEHGRQRLPEWSEFLRQAVLLFAADRGGQPRHRRPRRFTTACCWYRASAPATC